MASIVLHIKDSYYFEVPKALWPSNRATRSDFPEVWIRLDPEFQRWEAKQILNGLRGELGEQVAGIPADNGPLLEEYEHWKHDHANAGKPFDTYLRVKYEALKDAARREDVELSNYLKSTESPDAWIGRILSDPQLDDRFQANCEKADDTTEYIRTTEAWSPEKIEAYNKHLSGKILIPQPLPGSKLRNLYEAESGFCISKFMIVEVIVALLIIAVFGWLARRVADGSTPRGRRWNLLEVFVVFIRDQVARPAIGHHDGDRFVPLLLTLFFFVLGCNLMGMVPWVGAPTGSFGATFALACVTFGTVIIFGMLKFGPVGFFLNQIPGMDLPLILAIFIKPMILVIELLGLCIKHAVLSIRLLANMVAGHIVLLAIMTLAFSAAGAASEMWGVAAVISVLGSTLFSCLELFVAFLQAYIFAFLSALFIGAAIHHH